MTDIAIRSENLSKLYQIGRAQQHHDSLRDGLAAAFRRTKPQSAAHDGELWALRDVCLSSTAPGQHPILLDAIRAKQSARCGRSHGIWYDTRQYGHLACAKVRISIAQCQFR
jgi:hypothetical protein